MMTPVKKPPCLIQRFRTTPGRSVLKSYWQQDFARSATHEISIAILNSNVKE